MMDPHAIPTTLATPPVPGASDSAPPATTQQTPAQVSAFDAAAAPGQRYGRFALQRFHARGGLGEVHVAVDEELKRDVALKRMQARCANDPAAHRRFLDEAEITAKLEHPGIVPIYGLVQDEHGQPCYAMRFIEGESLAEAIKRFHGPPSADSTDKSVKSAKSPDGFSSLAFRQLLQRFISVCQTMAYAHSKRVIHRDLKPANIMLGPFGETLVVDWGLAREVPSGQQSAVSEREAVLPPRVNFAPFGTDEPVYTQAGQALGTIGYMAPEQAAGRWNVVGPCSDIYSLGATLYELLTGVRPIDGKNAAEALQKAQAGDFDAPRKVKANVPKPLEAACLKAMAFEPAERYATAEDLAADLEHWLADEPVLAWKEPWLLRARRWLKRHRTLAFSAVSAVLVAAALLGLLAIRLDREQRRTHQWLHFARESLDDQTTVVIDDLLGRQIQLTDEHKEYLRKTLSVYDRFTQETGADAASQAGVAGAYLRVANIRQRLGELGEAETAYRQALALFERLNADNPGAPEHIRSLAAGGNGLGMVLHSKGRHEEAEATFRTALAHSEQLASTGGTIAKDLQASAVCRNNLGNLLRDTGRRREAATEFRTALAIQAKLAQNAPSVHRYRYDVAKNHNNLGNLLRDLGQRDMAETEYRAALNIADPLATDFPTFAEYRQLLGNIRYNLGVLPEETGRRQQAEPEYRAAIVIQAKLATDFPAVPDYRHDLARSHYALGFLLKNLGRLVDAEPEFRAAWNVQEKLANEFPATPEYRSELARTHDQLGTLLRDLGKQAAGEREYRSALAIRTQLVAEFPKFPLFRSELATSHDNCGITLIETLKLTDAAAAFRAAIALHEQLAAEYPTVPEYRRELARAHQHLGIVLVASGQMAAAEQAHAAALKLQERLAAELPEVQAYAVELGNGYSNFGNLLRDSGRPADALPWYAKAMATTQPILAREPAMALARVAMRNACWGRAQALEQLRRYAEALADWDQAIDCNDPPQLRPLLRTGRALTLARQGDHARAVQEADDLAKAAERTGDDLYNLACVCALAAGAAKDDAKLQNQYAVRAVQLLRAAVGKGYKDTEQLKKDDDLKPLRERDDYKRLLSELQRAM